MTIIDSPTHLVRGDDLSALCRTVLASLPRADQRRWGEFYVRGLVELEGGRKSIRRISDEIVGQPAEQCLQQFVNQSPWDWRPVRAELARVVTGALTQKAWVVDDVVFPKSGDGSVGVDRQYAHTAGRTLNCQVGVALSLASENGCCPVDWRLTMPQTWHAQDPRRKRCRVPEDEIARPWGHYMGELFDALPAQWLPTPVPVLLDGRREQSVDAVLDVLERRGLAYMVRVAPSTVLPAGSVLAEAGRGVEPPEHSTMGRLAASAARDGGTMVWWQDAVGRQARSRIATVPVPHRPGVRAEVLAERAGVSRRGGATRRAGRPRRLVVEWRGDERQPHALWLTTLPPAHPSQLLALASLAQRNRSELDRMENDCGLQHFEGRSYRGWHHHVTLASVAHAYRRLARTRLTTPDARRMRPLA